jgi:murein DD-endopeptidase MepM/ murein hydrolase activator NlpD
MAESFQKSRKKWLAVSVFVLLSVICCCGCYIAGWQSRMEGKVSVYHALKEQGRESLSYALLREAKCFPVRQKGYSFEDGYGEGRSYGGDRKHEGIDIMSRDGKRGTLKVQSVSYGVVEQMGWLELGGYRVGIRSSSGLYFYYAHLDHYASNLKKGDTVKPGTLLGYMGDTGYGEEGTKGQFPVHLHFGIYYKEGDTEQSLNPYEVLLYLDNQSSKNLIQYLREG